MCIFSGRMSSRPLPSHFIHFMPYRRVTDLACTTYISGGISNRLELDEWLSSGMVWELVGSLFRGLVLFSARSWPEGKAV